VHYSRPPKISGMLVLTMGEDGALYVANRETVRESPAGVNDMIDTVGAGDAFSAVTILGLISGWPLRQTLRRALDFSAEVCRIQGAIAADHDICRKFLEVWNSGPT
ncbi:carbohydrate kinase family protein, partial [Acidobacteriota bacterium]